MIHRLRDLAGISSAYTGGHHRIEFLKFQKKVAVMHEAREGTLTVWKEMDEQGNVWGAESLQKTEQNRPHLLKDWK